MCLTVCGEVCEWYKGKKKYNSCPVPPVPFPGSGLLNYMLLVAVSWVQKDAFKLLHSKKYFLHKDSQGCGGNRVEKCMPCSQPTPIGQQPSMTFKSSYSEVLKMHILSFQWHLIKELFWIFLPLLFLEGGGGLSCDRCCVMLMLWVDEWENHGGYMPQQHRGLRTE